ncbi:hypothetical protein ABK040_013963 [Willaertia magna]
MKKGVLFRRVIHPQQQQDTTNASSSSSSTTTISNQQQEELIDLFSTNLIISDKKKSLPLTAENLKKFTEKQKVYRFFRCPDCYHDFWKAVYSYKEVARCKKNPRCKTYPKLEPLPIEFAFGKGYFKCDKCSNKWTSTNCNSNSEQPCLNCEGYLSKINYKPYKIGPSTIKGPRKSTRRHVCVLCQGKGMDFDCPSRRMKRDNRVCSKLHESTGSTISSVSSFGVNVDEIDISDSDDSYFDLVVLDE